MRRPGPAVILAMLVVMAVATAVVGPRIGTSGASLEQVFWSIRMPRLVMGMLAGMALSLAGMTFQAIFRNPLASPFTLGVASGASLAAALAIRLNVSGLWWAISVRIGLAFAGAMATVLLVYAIARARRGFGSTTLLLAGVSLSFVCSAGIVLIQFFSREHETTQIVRWLMGSVEVIGRTGWLTMIPAAALIMLGAGIVWRLHRDLDLLMMGDLTAASRGVSVGRSRGLAYFAASVMTASVVAICGPIAFVGLIVPHIMRVIIGPSHAWLAPGCLLAGMVFLPVCDGIAQNLMGWATGSSLQMPVGVVTSILGGLFFLYLLLAKRGDRTNI